MTYFDKLIEDVDDPMEAWYLIGLCEYREDQVEDIPGYYDPEATQCEVC